MRRRESIALVAGIVLLMVPLSCRNETPETPVRGDLVARRLRPERIVSLAGHLTEILESLGVDRNRIVGAVGGRPPAAGSFLPVDLGSAAEPDLATLIAVEADLVLTPPGPRIEAFLRRHGIPFAVIPMAELLDPVRAIRRIGVLVDRVEQAGELEDAIVSKILALKERIGGQPRRKVVLATSRVPTIFVGGHSFLNATLEFARAENVYVSAETEYVRHDPRSVLDLDPTAVLDVTDALAGRVTRVRRERRWWESALGTSLAGSVEILFLEDDALFVPGPRLAEGLEAVVRLLHPSAFD